MRTLSGWAAAGAGLWMLYAGETVKQQDGIAPPAGSGTAVANPGAQPVHGPAQRNVSLHVFAVEAAPEAESAGPDSAGADAAAAGPARQAPADPLSADPATLDLAAIEPGAAGPARDEPGGADPAVVDPAAIDPTMTDPDVAEPAPPGPGDVAGVPLSEIDRVDECMVAKLCIDRYLWSLYARTQKVDTVAVPEQVKVAVKKHGRVRMVAKTVNRFVLENFGWKDEAAAGKAKMAPEDYVIGGMDPRFRVRLYHALRILDDAGLMPGITSAFRDDYRQTIASGRKALSDRSFHGGSYRGGYGHGLAADIVSVKGDTHAQRLLSSDALWKYVDSHEKELGIGRPYLDFDAPHVGPLDGEEYQSRRGGAAHDRTADHGRRHLAALHDHRRAVRARTSSRS